MVYGSPTCWARCSVWIHVHWNWHDWSSCGPSGRVSMTPPGVRLIPMRYCSWCVCVCVLWCVCGALNCVMCGRMMYCGMCVHVCTCNGMFATVRMHCTPIIIFTNTHTLTSTLPHTHTLELPYLPLPPSLFLPLPPSPSHIQSTIHHMHNPLVQISQVIWHLQTVQPPVLPTLHHLLKMDPDADRPLERGATPHALIQEVCEEVVVCEGM